MRHGGVIGSSPGRDEIEWHKFFSARRFVFNSLDSSTNNKKDILEFTSEILRTFKYGSGL